MKLIRLYIENFGALSHFSLEFQEGVTALNQPNGFGKTTLAEFIRAMFYGFPRKTKSPDKSRRQKYLPWGGGVCGGYLEFEHEGGCYRIERSFGTVPREDTFDLTDLSTNKRSTRYCDQIGQELFGLDADSFERSVYLPQLCAETALSTASIQAKLTALVEDGSDVANFDKAMAQIRSARSARISYRGNGGSVAELGAEISRLQTELDRAQQQEAQAAAAQTDAQSRQEALEKMQIQLQQVRERMAAAAETAAAALRQEQYAMLSTRYRDAALLAGELEAKYPKGLPDEQQLQTMEKVSDRLAALQVQPGEGRTIQTPFMQEIRENREKCAKLDGRIGQIWDLESRREALLRTQRETAAMKGAVKTALALLGIVWVAGWSLGVAAALHRQMLWVAAGLAAGIAAAVGVLCLLLTHRKNCRENMKMTEREDRALQRELAAAEAAAKQDRLQIAQFLLPYFGETEPGQFALCLLKLEHEAQLQEQARLRHSEAEACLAQLDRFFAVWELKPEGDFRAALRNLREEAQKMRLTCARRQELAEQMTVFRREFAAFLTAEVQTGEDMGKLRTREQYLQDQLSEHTEQLLQLRQNIRFLHGQAEQIPRLRRELEELREKQKQQREEARILDETMAFLQQARENLSNAYLGTIRSRFSYYLNCLEECGEQTYLIDSDLQVKPERMGKTRELSCLSAGQTDLLLLCMRFALVDAMFDSNEMFVVLDDPFVNLDDGHLQQAKRLLHRLAGQRQILYLTCHSGRTV